MKPNDLETLRQLEAFRTLPMLRRFTQSARVSVGRIAKAVPKLNPTLRRAASDEQEVIFSKGFSKGAGSEWVLVPAQEQIHGSRSFTDRRFRTQAF